MIVLRIIIVAVVAIGATFGLSHALFGGPKYTEQAARLDSYDADLQAAATAALGEREGAIVVIDPQTGRIRALVNPRLAYQTAFPPGSTIKPFTTLAALRSGVIKEDARVRCRGKHKREDVVDSCSHPTDLTPLDAAEALAYSCNYYFATVGERLDENSFGSILEGFGFGQPTGINAEDESKGSLARGQWQPQSAIGEGEFLQVTPVQLVTAYAALFNGGKLFKPAFSSSDFTPQLRSNVQIDDRERATLFEGMRGAVVFGTAEKANLPAHIIGKTGTSTQLQGFRTQGWFTGIAFAPGTTEPQLAVVIYLKNAVGSEAQEVARPLFENRDATFISVSHHNETHKLTLEDYVLQVVSAEASVEDEPEALKALAITARTYALKNLARHHDEGYDFCSSTHCQRFELTAARPSLTAAVKETNALVLRDSDNQIVDSYFSASCGGMTANAGTLWPGAETHTYLQGVPDKYCHTGSHYRWTDTIAPEELSAALRNDPRTDVGEKVHAISVAKFDGTGRAELVSITGDRRRVVNGWDFKLIIGRTLGWNHVKSSRFTVARSGSQFVFRGGGFGHGLGLCQEGSHAMAQQGHSFRQILAHYFPGTRVSRGDNAETRLEVGAPVRSASASQRVSALHFHINSQSTIETDEAEQLINVLETSRRDLLQRVTAAGISVNFPHLEIVVNRTTGDFVGRTGLPSWAAAGTKSNRVELQPLRLLKQRRILETTIRHELVHVLVDTIGGGQTPRWFTEGLAIHLAGEGRWMKRPQQLDSIEAIEEALRSAESKDEMRIAYAAAYEFMRTLIRNEGEHKIWKRVAEGRYSVA